MATHALPPLEGAVTIAAAQRCRSQVARLEGVQPLPVPPHLEAAASAEPPLSARVGTANSDRLRLGWFVYVTAGAQGRGGRRGPKSGSGVSLLQGLLLPSLFSFQPALAFTVAAFGGGEHWMLSLDLLGAPEAAAAAAGAAAGHQLEPSPSSIARPAGGGGSSAAEKRSPEAWQLAQAQRLAAVQGMHGGPAAGLLTPQPVADEGPPPLARCFLSSAQLEAAGGNGAAGLESAALPAFRAALSLHLNSLAAAPAEADRAHVRRAAEWQAACVAAAVRRPLLCSAQLETAMGPAWLRDLQVCGLQRGSAGCPACAAASTASTAAAPSPTAALPLLAFPATHTPWQAHLEARGQEGLGGALAAAQAGGEAGATASGEWVLFDPAMLLDS